MPKRIIIGLLVLSAAALLWTDAHAGCITIPQPNGTRFCASYITGGSEIGLLTVESSPTTPEDQAVPPVCAVVTSQGPGSGEGDGPILLTAGIAQAAVFPPIELKLAGTVKPTGTPRNAPPCGLGPTDNQLCDIKGVVFCGSSTTGHRNNNQQGQHDDDDDDDDNNGGASGRRATTQGPLLVTAGGLSQVDPTARGGLGRGFAGFRFQLSPEEQLRLCPGPASDPFTTTFRTFVAEQGFFQARVNDKCLREKCSVNVNGLQPDDPRIYSCQRIFEGACN